MPFSRAEDSYKPWRSSLSMVTEVLQMVPNHRLKRSPMCLEKVLVNRQYSRPLVNLLF